MHRVVSAQAVPAPVVFAHGIAGSPEGAKATALRALGLRVVAPDGRGQPLQARMDALRAALDAHPGAVLVGSSYGGLAALALAAELAERPDALSGVVLLAPAVSLREHPVHQPDRLVVPPTVPLAVIHGRRDDVIPVAASRALVRRHPHARYHEVDDGHDLRETLPLMVDVVRELALATAPAPA